MSVETPDRPGAAGRLLPRVPADPAPLPPPVGRGELVDLLLHHAPHGLPDVRLRFADVTPDPADLTAAARLAAAFARAAGEEAALEARPAGDIWAGVAAGFHGECLDALRAGDPPRLAALLADACRRDVTHGLGPGRQVYDAARRTGDARIIATLCVDRLVALAEAVGVLPMENPEQGVWGEHLYLDPAEVLAALDARLGVDLLPGQAMGYFGVDAGRGAFFVRSADHAYAAWRCLGLGATRVAEIGGGLAGVGDYAMRLGAASYAVYDLPVINVLQGFALIRAGLDVSLLGEPEAPVRVRPWWHLEHAPPADVVINQDSLPEIDPTIGVGYLRQIRARARWFLSINQEGASPFDGSGRRQTVVADLVAEAGGYRRLARAPYWLRRGYVEELFEAA